MDAPESKLGKKRRRKKEEKKQGKNKENVEHSCIVVTTMTLLRSADQADMSTNQYRVRLVVHGKDFY